MKRRREEVEGVEVEGVEIEGVKGEVMDVPVVVHGAVEQWPSLAWSEEQWLEVVGEEVQVGWV